MHFRVAGEIAINGCLFVAVAADLPWRLRRGIKVKAGS
jgi:hypothetical protein